MDPLSATASIVAILQLAGTVAQYLNSVVNTPKERDVIFREISAMIGVLFLTKDVTERAQKEKVLLGSVSSLAVPAGQLEQFSGDIGAPGFETISFRSSKEDRANSALALR